jgi:hypothetical protein
VLAVGVAVGSSAAAAPDEVGVEKPKPKKAEQFGGLLNGADAALRTSEDEVARRSAAQELRERLEEVSRALPDLTGKCADLQGRLDEVLRLDSDPF